MADNYLEKQREQYEARKAAWEKARKYGKKKSKRNISCAPAAGRPMSTDTQQEDTDGNQQAL